MDKECYCLWQQIEVSIVYLRWIWKFMLRIGATAHFTSDTRKNLNSPCIYRKIRINSGGRNG